MGRRGFFAEMQHQMKVAAREQAAAQRAANRAHRASVRRAEQARKAEERALKQLSRAEEADRKRLAKESRDAHIAAMESEVEAKNLELAALYDEIDSLLAATLDVDDYVDLDTLRIGADHPPFDTGELEKPLPPPDPMPDPPAPTFQPPAAPRGIRVLFARNKHARAVAEATAEHEEALAVWQEAVAQRSRRRQDAADAHARAEAQRVAALEAKRSRYEEDCSAREAEAAERSRAIDALIANLGYGTIDAVQEYVSIVLSNSVYPPHFQVTHDFSFDPTTAELRLQVLIPGPDRVPDTKSFKYTKSSDEITTTSLSKKACRERYASAVHQVALRSLHEVFEADRRAIIKTISLEIGTETIHPATGRESYLPFVAVGAERDSFLQIDLTNVVPAATLDHLGAAVSKNPFGLIAADTSGIRRS